MAPRVDAAVPLNLPRSLDRDAARRMTALAAALPLRGRPIRLSFAPCLHAHRGKLRSGDGPGSPVHAASFLRTRRMVLASELLACPEELARILTHELFHFAWPRLGNQRRRQWEQLLEGELRQRARGELGWSSEWRKQKLAAADARSRSRRWREYLCEAFCDSAAWLYCGAGSHEEFTLAPRFRLRRRRWFAAGLPATLTV